VPGPRTKVRKLKKEQIVQNKARRVPGPKRSQSKKRGGLKGERGNFVVPHRKKIPKIKDEAYASEHQAD